MTASLPTRRVERSLGDVGRGLGAVAALFAFLFGVPAALIALAPEYLPAQVPSWSRLRDLVLSPDDGTLLFAVIGAVAWLAWAAFTASVLVEVVAGLRRVRTPRLPFVGSMQSVAARLVATAGVLLAVSWTSGAHAQAAPVVAAVVADTAPSPAVTSGPSAAVDVASATPAATLPVVIVQRGDTLWGIAERHLGSGARYTEIRDLNLGRLQPDGRTLTAADWILPGWTMLLPADAMGVEPTPDSAPISASSDGLGGERVVVQPGDTLWAIAAQHLGDGEQYTEIAKLNRGRPQLDGSALTAPDLIRVGWILELPADGAGAAAQPVPRQDAAPDAAPLPAAAVAPDEAVAPAGLTPSPSTSSLTESPTPGASSEAPSTAGAAAELARDTADDEDYWAIVTDPWFLGFTALGAAGIVGEIARRRHLQQRARRLGETIPLPDRGSPAESAERTLRSAGTPLSIASITMTLANVGCRCFEAGQELPRVGIVLLDEHRLTLQLVEDAPDAVAPFRARDARTWTAAIEDVAAEEPIDDPEQCNPYPVLVTLGQTDDATLIVNLEAAGTLAVAGESHTADEALRALVIEAATSELSGQLCVSVDETLTDLAGVFEPHRLKITADVGCRAEVTVDVRRCLSAQGLDDTLQARGDRQAPDTWLPVTYVENAAAESASEPWSGTTLIVRAEAPGAWTIRIDLSGTAHLKPWDIDFMPQRLADEQLETLKSLLRTSLPPAPGSVPVRTGSIEDEIETLHTIHPVESARDLDPPRVVIKVLGPIEIEGLPETGSNLSPRMRELLVYLALHGPATGAELDDILWDGTRIKHGTRNALVYRTRLRVGEAVLPFADSEGRYRLGDGVSSDWSKLQRFLAEGLADAAESHIDQLAKALSLVRSRPFRGIGGGEFPWADADIQLMTSIITDTAHVLTNLLHEQGRSREALEVAHRGLQFDPFSPALQQDAAAAAEPTSGRIAADSLRPQFSARLLDLDPEAAG